MINRQLTRRQFLSTSASVLLSATAATATDASEVLQSVTTSDLIELLATHAAQVPMRLIHYHTKETLLIRPSLIYSGSVQRMAESFLRDFRTGQLHPIDPKLFVILQHVREKLQTIRPIQILSGYRSKSTNDRLRKRSNRVAKHSLHLTGQAIDFTIPGISTKQLFRAARSAKSGGVGYYAKSSFVHIDTGHVRYWHG